MSQDPKAWYRLTPDDAFGRLDCVTDCAIMKRRQDNNIHLFFNHLDRSNDQQRVHSQYTMFRVIFEYPNRENHRPVLIDGLPDLMRKH